MGVGRAGESMFDQVSFYLIENIVTPAQLKQSRFSSP